jgi:DNA-binding NarL/FixJ family response regulator
MPGMDGVETIKAVLRRRPELHVVAFTSVDDRRIVELLLSAGASAHFPKENIDGLVRYVVDHALAQRA